MAVTALPGLPRAITQSRGLKGGFATATAAIAVRAGERVSHDLILTPDTAAAPGPAAAAPPPAAAPPVPGLPPTPAPVERANLFDVGATQNLFDGLKIGLDLYYKFARDGVDFGQFGAPIITIPFNYGIVANRGVELTTTYEKGPFSY